ncbi:MAG TPA: TonB-dependent receptor plug domain-containing protein [Longimicrobiales bacterium]|nr:TonB-dependent receptor plug domain-containing protein [Longimicrobiales bacterium]
MTRILPVPAAAVVLAVLLFPGCHNRAMSTDPHAPEVTGTGPVVDADEVDGQQAVRMEELLIGRFPGVRVIVEPGGGISVRVWGPGTMSGRDPLYVVDGMPIQVTPGRGLDWLNPADIETIRVLKDISDTAAYGVRGANGVVVITTRRGGDAEA